MKHHIHYLFISLISLFFCTCSSYQLDNTTPVNRLPNLLPDYSELVIPPNIAPLNFLIDENGNKFTVQFKSESVSFQLDSDNKKIYIPKDKWRTLLQANKGDSFTVTVFVYTEDRWHQFQSFTNRVAKEPIDNTLVYRLIDPAYHIWSEMGIYQRDLTTFNESVIFHNRTAGHACVNCHSFHQNNPDKMMFHMRGGPGTALLLSVNGEMKNINTGTRFNRAGAYRCWHPNGKLIAFSANDVAQFFHATGENRDVYDTKSDLVLYNIETNTITTNPQISSLDYMETYPMWTPDGKTLYFCRAPQADFSDKMNIPYDTIFYDLVRISYDPQTGEWGDLQTVLSREETGKSIAHPSISPDGRYLIFCMAKYGNFTIYRPDSDLYLMDLQTREYQYLDINSDKSDSYHSWSSNGRWIVFSSKRGNGICARPYFSYFAKGKTYKPFILCQKDPEFYKTYFKTYNVPELVTGPVEIKPQQWAKAAHWSSINANLDPDIKARKLPAEMDMPWQPFQR